MPNVAGKKFPYTKQGMKDAAKAMKKVMGMKGGGSVLQPVDKMSNPGLAKLPTGVRNKMGYMKKGGMVKKNYMHGGEIKGTPPAQVSGKMFKRIF